MNEFNIGLVCASSNFTSLHNIYKNYLIFDRLGVTKV